MMAVTGIEGRFDSPRPSMERRSMPFAGTPPPGDEPTEENRREAKQRVERCREAVAAAVDSALNELLSSS